MSCSPWEYTGPLIYYVGRSFAGMGFVAETKSCADTKYEVEFDRCFLRDILPQEGGGDESLVLDGKEDDDQNN